MPNFQIGKEIEPHPEYSSQAMARQFWRWSDRASPDYAYGADASGRSILPQHEREPSSRFERRKGQAIVRRYVRPIINRYNDFVTREKPDRPEGTAPYQQLLIDANGRGCPIDELAKRTLRSAQIDGVAYWLADANLAQENLTQAQDKESGKRGIIRSIDPNAVIWWQDAEGELTAAVILMQSREGAFAWYIDESATQKILFKKDDTGKNVVTQLFPPQFHNYGGCPLVRIKINMSADCGDDSQASPLAEGQKRICNLDSWLLEEIQGATFTTSVFLGVDYTQVKDVAIGPGMALCLPGETGKNPAIDRLGADVAQAESIRQSLMYEIKELYRCAGLSPGNPTESATPESGVAKAFAFNEINATCAAMADTMESAENKIVKMLSKAFAWAYPGDCDYPDDFESVDLSDELDKLLKMQAAGIPKVMLENQVRAIAKNAFALNGEEKNRMEAEMSEPEKEEDFTSPE